MHIFRLYLFYSNLLENLRISFFSFGSEYNFKGMKTYTFKVLLSKTFCQEYCKMSKS